MTEPVVEEPAGEGPKERLRDKCDCDPLGCDLPDCDLPGCDCDPSCDIVGVVRLSSLLAAVAVAPPPKRVVLAGLRGYRRWVGPRLPIRCPCTPSCSAYASEAVRRYGARRGLSLAAARLRRCGTVRGHDPLP